MPTDNTSPTITSRNKCPVCGGKKWWPMWYWHCDGTVTKRCGVVPTAAVIDAYMFLPYATLLDECARCGTVVTG